MGQTQVEPRVFRLPRGHWSWFKALGISFWANAEGVADSIISSAKRACFMSRSSEQLYWGGSRWLIAESHSCSRGYPLTQRHRDNITEVDELGSEASFARLHPRGEARPPSPGPGVDRPWVLHELPGLGGCCLSAGAHANNSQGSRSGNREATGASLKLSFDWEKLFLLEHWNKLLMLFKLSSFGHEDWKNILLMAHLCCIDCPAEQLDDQ